jgi:hypothetical protein
MSSIGARNRSRSVAHLYQQALDDGAVGSERGVNRRLDVFRTNRGEVWQAGKIEQRIGSKFVHD